MRSLKKRKVFMKKCFFSKQYKFYGWLNLLLSILIGIIIALIGAFLKDVSSLGRCLLVVSGLLVMVYFGLFVLFLNRKYIVNEKGITIQYTDRKRVFYSWETIQSVCICITHRSGTGTTQDTVILCTTRPADRLISAEVRLHTSWEYDFFHCNSIILIEYSEDRMKEFSSYYRKSIQDYRMTEEKLEDDSLS